MKIWEYSLGKEPNISNKVVMNFVDRRRLSAVFTKFPSLYLSIMKYKITGILVSEIAFQVNVLWLEICGSFKLPRGK